jgi:GT2 family glycosyltransferase
MQDFDVSVTICSWNTKEDLRRCLRSLEGQEGVRLEVIVVDNASEDGSPDMVAEEFPHVVLIRNERNLGFGGGHNQAFQRASGEFFMPLNSDTTVHPGCLLRLVEFLRANPSVGIAAPKLLNPDGTLQYSCRRFPTPAAAVFRNTFLGRLFPNNRYAREYLMADWDHSVPRDVDWVSGAAFCYRRAVYEKVGGFDERFFMYLEDVDLCKRVQEAGYRVVYVPDAVVTHKIGASTDRVANRMIRQFHRSMLLYYQKHHISRMSPVLRPFATFLGWLFVNARASLFLIKNAVDAVSRRLRGA